MNKFMRWLLNVPDGNLVNVLKMDDENNGTNDSKFLFDKVKYVFNVDIEKIVSDSINKTNAINKLDGYSLTECFRTLIQEFDKSIAPKYDFFKRESGNIKDYYDYNYEYTSKYSENGKIEYLLCNLYQIIMSVNHNEQFKFQHFPEKFSKLVYSDYDESSSKKSNNAKEKIIAPVSVNSIRKHLKMHYENNILSFLFLQENLFEQYCLSSPEEIRKIQKENYSFTEATEEIQIATVFTGAKNVYNDKYKRDSKYSFTNLKTFNRKYYEVLDSVCKLKRKNCIKNGEFNIELHCNKYISDMIYAFNLTSLMSNIVTDEEFDDDRLLIETVSLLILIPDIRRRMDYFFLIMYVFTNYDAYNFTIFKIVISDNINYEEKMYYPLLTLAAIEYVRRIALRERENKNAATYFINNLSAAFNEIKKDLSNFESLYSGNEKIIESPFVMGFYKMVTEKLFNLNSYTNLGLKITTHEFKPQDMVHCILKMENKTEKYLERLNMKDEEDIICKHKLRASDITECLDCIFLKSYMKRKITDIL